MSVAVAGIDRVVLWIGRAILPTAFKADLLHAFGGDGAARLVELQLQQLDHATLARLAPCAVFSQLNWSCCDAHDVAQALRLAGYRGPYRVLVPPLPDPDMIVDEVRASHPGLDFGLLELGGEDRARVC